MKMNKLCSNLDQSNPTTGGFTDEEKQTMRNNIGAAASTDVTNKSEIKVFEGSSTVHKDLMTIYAGSSTGALAGIAFNNEPSNVTMVKKPEVGDGGKVLTVVEPGGQIAPYYEWSTINTVPDYAAADAGKRLQVNGSGTGLIWSDSVPTRHVWGYELNPNVFTEQTSLTDFQVSSTGVTLHFQIPGDYFVTGMFCMSNDNGTHPEGFISVKYVVDDSKSSATYSRLDNNLGYWPIHSGSANTYPGGYVHGMITSRIRVGTPGYINFKWYVSFANLTAEFTNSTSISGASYLCFPNNFATHLGNHPSNVMSFYAEKI